MAGLWATLTHARVWPGIALFFLERWWLGRRDVGERWLAASLLATVKRPTEAQIRTAMNGHLCRCGTYPRVFEAALAAAQRFGDHRGDVSRVPLVNCLVSPLAVETIQIAVL